MTWDYDILKEAIKKLRPPVMIVDMDILDSNINRIKSISRKNGKTIRVASKSVRSVEILSHIMNLGAPVFKGLMCFSASEAEFLYEKGFDDLLIAYPSVNPLDFEILRSLTDKGANVSIIVDMPEHISAIEKHWKDFAKPLGVSIEVDMSYRPIGKNVHLGVQRSSIRSFSEFKKFISIVEKTPCVKLKGVMGYEAQIAGVGEENPFFPLLNPVKMAMKKLSIKDVASKRERIGQWLQKKGIEIEFFNGGGTGSLLSTSRESVITEVAAGSGFLQSHLFDYYADNENEGAFCFALQVTRLPEKDVVTCQSGGFMASGEIGEDKAPLPIFPKGMEVFKSEGFGEVQTPLKNTKKHPFKVGDPVFFRPAKAGEIAERFSEYHLMRKGIVLKKALTYRGEGKCFF